MFYFKVGQLCGASPILLMRTLNLLEMKTFSRDRPLGQLQSRGWKARSLTKVSLLLPRGGQEARRMPGNVAQTSGKWLRHKVQQWKGARAQETLHPGFQLESSSWLSADWGRLGSALLPWVAGLRLASPLSAEALGTCVEEVVQSIVRTIWGPICIEWALSCAQCLLNESHASQAALYLSKPWEPSACCDWTHMPQNSASQVVPVFLVVRAFGPFNNLFPGRIS